MLSESGYLEPSLPKEASPRKHSRMFSFITETLNLTLQSFCPYGCVYCWAKKYQGRHINAETLKNRWNRRFKKGSFIFLNDLTDAFAYNVPDVEILATYRFIRLSPEAKFLLMTKNPDRYVNLCPPENAILGCTIESDASSDTYINHSNAPTPLHRIAVMEGLASAGFHDLFISIEPIMEFNRIWFPEVLTTIKPWGIAVGYDNYSWNLPEPSLARTNELIVELRKQGIIVYEKTLRKAWWEK